MLTHHQASLSTRKASLTPSLPWILAILAALTGVSANAAILDVCASGCTYTSIEDAVDAASSGDVIELDPGTYFEGGIFINKSLDIRTSSGRATIDGGSEYYVFKVAADQNVEFEDLTLRGGTRCRLDNAGQAELWSVFVHGTGPANPSAFGGILNRAAGSMIIANASAVGGNASNGYGGGITNRGDLVISASTVGGNFGKSGGGLLNLGGIVSVTSSSLTANLASHKGGAWANLHGGSVLFGSSAAASANSATVDCDTYWDQSGSPSCVD